jgi:hypothetical protein
VKKQNIILLFFVILKFILQYFVVSPEYDLHRDEFLHLDQANHLAWGYFSVPPLTSWFSTIIYILGGSVFWVRFFPALFGALTIVFVWKATEELNGNLFALILSATCVLFSTLLRMNILYQPNSFDILSWTALYFFIIKYFNTEKAKWIYVAALVFGVAFLNKYNILFLLIGLIPAILLTTHRKLFIKKELYLALILGLLIIFPNLLWQFKNDFPVFQHLKELTDTQLLNADRLDFLKSQLSFFIGSLFVILSAIFALIFYKPFEKYKPFFWIIIFTLAIFTYFRAKGYYAIGIYPIYIAFGSVFLGNILHNGWKRYFKPVLIILPILFFILMYDFVFPSKSPEYILTHPQKYQRYGMLRWEDGKDHNLPQDFADMLGWKELATKMDSIYSTLPNPDNTFILCDNYGEAGAINYYTKNKNISAHTYNADYINWFTFDKNIEDMVLVKEDYFDRDRDRQRERQIFETVYLAGQRINQYAREDTISIYVLKGAKVDVNEVLKAEIEARKYWGR